MVSMPMFIRILVCGLLALIGAGNAYAQDKGPKDFFPPDYVNQEDSNGSSKAIPQGTALPRPTSGTSGDAKPGPTGVSVSAGSSAAPTSSETPVAKTRYENLPHLPLSKIITVGAVLDATNAEYTKARYLDFLEYAASKRLSISRVFFLGPPSWLQLSDMIVLQSFGSWFESSAKLPPKVQVERTPSWIIETENGTVILDGIDNFEQFITDDNKLSLVK